MDYEKKEAELLDNQKLEREAFYTGVELYKILDEVNAERVKLSRDQISMEDMLENMEEFLLKKV